MGELRIAAVIQARMGSTRLPGKVLMSLAGKPLLWHIVHRLRKCRMVNLIAIATSALPVDDPLVEFARGEGIELVRGPEDDVLRRFSMAARQIDADVIIRVTGDAPLIDPSTIDGMVETLILENAEYCMGEAGVSSINEGFCTFSRGALDRLSAEAAFDPIAVEHVTAYFKTHPESFRIVQLPVAAEHRFQGARISVDTPADLRFIEELYHRLGSPPGDLEITEVVELLRTTPELLEINGHIYQKKATDSTVKVLVRCDGDASVGLGHVVRTLAIADELRERHGFGLTFAMATGEPGVALVRAKGFPVILKPGELDEGDWLDALLAELKPGILILDVRTSLARENIAPWRRNGIFIVTIDDLSERRLESDLVFYPPVPQVNDSDWEGFSGELCAGWDWIPLRPGFSGGNARPDHHPPRLLVTMGGSDPAGLTLRCVRLLDALEGEFETTLVLGACYRQESELADLLSRTRRSVQVLRDVRDMQSVMAGADLALASFGMTAYELAAMGVPAVHLCLSPDHARSASLFVGQGIALLGRVHDEVGDDQLIDDLNRLLTDTSLRLTMAQKARTLLDGRGAEHIADKIVQRSLRPHA